MTKKQFILMRGIPGSGKSTLAFKLAGTDGKVFSTDDFWCQNQDKEYRFNVGLLGQAHKWNQDRVFKGLIDNIPIVVVDNTNTTLKELKSYKEHIELAKMLGYEVSIEEPITEWAWDIDGLLAHGTHNVPRETMEKMLSRFTHGITVEDILAE
jgi:NEDD4-binding protein 2